MKFTANFHKQLLTTLCILSLSPALLFAGEPPKPVEERGVIKSVDVSAHTLVITENKKNTDQKFQWTDQTKFIEHDKSVTASALKADERVQLIYTPGGTTPTLKSVHITPAKAAKPGANNISPARSTAV